MPEDLFKLSKEEIKKIYSIIEKAVQENVPGITLESLDNWNNYVLIREGNDKENGNVVGTLNLVSDNIYIKDSNYYDKLGVLSYYLTENFGNHWKTKKRGENFD